jgi:uracil-DNA glycosylase
MLNISTWDDMEFWRTGEWQKLEERMDDLDKLRKQGSDRGWYNPKRSDLFTALDNTPFGTVKVAVFGQDPYPEPKFCTGVAFSIPEEFKPKDFPPTLRNIFKEYSDDLHLTQPTSGDLTSWCEQGVLLWNATPTCKSGVAGSHHGWVEWEELNKEIIALLNNSGVVFVFLGAWARQYEKYVDDTKNKGIVTSHPSPLGAMAGKNPFFGSRIFSRINDYLIQLNNDPIDWKLKGSRTMDNTNVRAS